MRVALLNWAKVWDGASVGGGVNGYGRALAVELKRRGHEVCWLCSGTAYEAGGRRGDRVGPVRVDRHEDWLGVRVDEVVNSPVLAPSLAQFRDPMAEVSSPELEEVVRRWAAEVRPDAVYVQNIEGFSAGCVGAIRRGWSRARVVYALHNYHTVCPQVYLMQGHRRPCVDFHGGSACEGCVPSVEPGAERLRRATGGPPPPPPRFAGETRGRTGEVLSLERPHPWSEAGVSLPAWRPLLNVVPTGVDHGACVNEYGSRRRAMVSMLNSCEALVAVSRFVRELFVSMGVEGSRVRTVGIGSVMPEIVARRPEAIVGPPAAGLIARGERALRLVFMGYHSWYKGLPMLVDALEMLTPEVLGRVHLTVLALGGEQMEPALRRLEPRLAGLRLQHGYEQEDVPWLVSGADLGVVPSVWWDNGPQTVLEFLACGVPVLGARLGGIPDVVREGENGMLFTGNDRWDLARRIAGVVRAPGVLEGLRRGIGPVKTMRAHGGEVEALLGEVCGTASAGR